LLQVFHLDKTIQEGDNKLRNLLKLAGTQEAQILEHWCSRIWSKKSLFAVLLCALFV